MFADMVTGITGALSALEVDPAAIEDVRRQLDDLVTTLDTSTFHDLEVSPAAFGGSPLSAQFGSHHQMAKQVIADTLRGLKADLEGFAAATAEAAQLIDTADTTSAEAMSSRRQAVEVLQDAVRHSQADAEQQESRNEHVPAGATAPLAGA